MGITERKSREKEELRQEILNAARELFLREGYQNVSMRRIAEKIEYSPTTIYLYFRDKADLLNQICDETFIGLLKRLESIERRDLPPLEKLKRVLRAYVEFGLEHPHQYTLVFMTPQPEEECPCEQGEKCFNFLVQAVQACVDRGEVPEGNVPVMARLLWSGLHGLTSLLITFPDFEWGDQAELIRSLPETLVAGLKALGTKGTKKKKRG